MRILYLVLCLFLSLSLNASRIKDITLIEGGRDNQLIGYGLVVGLAGTGDSQLNYTVQSVANSLMRFGIKVDPSSLKSDNVAAVMITADIGPFYKPGTRLDVTVSSLGDADTLQGGVLLQTPLVGADGEVYAVAQGALVIGGHISGAAGSTVQKNHPTVGVISGGAIVEREISTEIVDDGEINILLMNPDYTSAVRIADAINREFPGCSQANSSNLVNVRVPSAFKNQEVNFVAIMGQIEVVPDTAARIVVNERTGTIVATHNVRLSKVAVSHSVFVIVINETPVVSQPLPFTGNGGPLLGDGPRGEGLLGGRGGAETVVTETVDTEAKELQGAFEIINNYPTIERLTSALNAMGVTTRDMISILQSMKKAGALQAELIIN